MSKQNYTGHPEARKTKYNPLAWINLVLLAVVVIACNYIGCMEYARRDLSQDMRYTISDRTINVLSSDRIQKRETPVRIIFAFKRSTPNFNRMYSLLEEYERYGKGKIEVERFDPVRQPNRAREISQIYGVEFKQDLCIIDARKDPNAPIKTILQTYFTGTLSGLMNIDTIQKTTAPKTRRTDTQLNGAIHNGNR